MNSIWCINCVLLLRVFRMNFIECTNGHGQTRSTSVKHLYTHIYFYFWEKENMSLRGRGQEKKSKNNQFNLCRLAHVFHVRSVFSVFSFVMFSSFLFPFGFSSGMRLCVWHWLSHNNWNKTTSETMRWNDDYDDEDTSACMGHEGKIRRAVYGMFSRLSFQVIEMRNKEWEWTVLLVPLFIVALCVCLRANV